MRVVALEEHCTFPDLAARIGPEAITARGLTPGGHRPPAFDRAAQLPDTGEARLADMDAAGITVQADWEVELGIVIGTKARWVPEGQAMDHVAGYCVINDVSEREYQAERGGTWDKGKGCDTFGPTGPWMVTKDEVPDPQAIDLWCDVDGQRMQHGNTSTMIFGVRHLVSYVSQFITLHPGDLIATGTPPGVGLGKKPEPVFLQAGQVMQAGVQVLGEQRQKLVASPAPT